MFGIIGTGAMLQPGDAIFGGSETNDTLKLSVAGTGSSSGTFDFSASTMLFVGVDEVQLTGPTGAPVQLTFGNSNVVFGQTFVVDGSADTSTTQSHTVIASAVTDGANIDFITASSGLNTLTGGSGNDIFQITATNFDLDTNHFTGAAVATRSRLPAVR